MQNTLQNYLLNFISICIPSPSISPSCFISFSVLYSQRLTRIVESASSPERPNPTSELDICWECDEHAEPADTHIPFPDKKLSIVSLFILGKATLIIWGARSPVGVFIFAPAKTICSSHMCLSSRSFSRFESKVSNPAFAAAPKPTIPSKFSVPERKPFSWPPPTI